MPDLTGDQTTKLQRRLEEYVGSLASLATTAQSNIVAAINEVASEASDADSAALVAHSLASDANSYAALAMSKASDASSAASAFSQTASSALVKATTASSVAAAASQTASSALVKGATGSSAAIVAHSLASDANSYASLAMSKASDASSAASAAMSKASNASSAAVVNASLASDVSSRVGLLASLTTSNTSSVTDAVAEVHRTGLCWHNIGTVGHADLTESGNGVAEQEALSTIPAPATVVDVLTYITTAFTGGGAVQCTVAVGTAGNPDLFAEEHDCLGTGDTTWIHEGQTNTDKGTGLYTVADTNRTCYTSVSAIPVIAEFTPDGANDLAGLTAGSLTVWMAYYSASTS